MFSGFSDLNSCSNCGSELSLKGRFCKGCGFDADLSESEDAYLDGIELPETSLTDSDYNQLLGHERLGGKRPRKNPVWVGLVLLTTAAFAFTFVFRGC